MDAQQRRAAGRQAEEALEADGEVEVAARWIVREGAGGRIRSGRDARYSERASGNDTPSVVEAWNKALAALSKDISDGITGLGPRDGGGGDDD